MKTCFTMTNIEYKLSNRDGYPSRTGRCNAVVTHILKTVCVREAQNHSLVLQKSVGPREQYAETCHALRRGVRLQVSSSDRSHASSSIRVPRSSRLLAVARTPDLLLGRNLGPGFFPCFQKTSSQTSHFSKLQLFFSKTSTN